MNMKDQSSRSSAQTKVPLLASTLGVSASRSAQLYAPVPAPGTVVSAVLPVAEGHVSAPVASRTGRGSLRAFAAMLRPRQWVKNGLVIAAAGAAGALGRHDVVQHVLVAFGAFCLLASGIYAVNDVRDAEEDRRHPRKCRRPVAAGDISPAAALSFGAALLLAGVAVCAALSSLLALVGCGYVALTLSYTLLWRYVVVVDILAIAGGFVLRALAGGVAARVPLSLWFLLVVSAAAICLAGAKRLAELRRTERSGANRRRVLRYYSTSILAVVLTISAAVALVAYCMWAARLPANAGIPWRPLTIAPFAIGLGRYLLLVRGGGGETPEELVLSDPTLLGAGCLWVVLFALTVHAGA